MFINCITQLISRDFFFQRSTHTYKPTQNKTKNNNNNKDSVKDTHEKLTHKGKKNKRQEREKMQKLIFYTCLG